MYALIDVDGKENKKAKGVNKNVAKNIRNKKFVDVLFNEKIMSHEMKKIQSKFHRIRTYNVCKSYLYCFDDKRYILGNSINSLAYFHEDVKIE